MKRSKHSLSRYILSTFDMGELIPVNHFEVLPGDSVRMSTSCLLRVSPLMTPVMHPVVVRLHHWFVPYRLLWAGWEDFITGGPDGTGTDLDFPEVDTLPAWTGPGSLADYLGVPLNSTGLSICLFPFFAYNRIFNEFYRDQDLQGEAQPEGGTIHQIAWEKDIFTAARPWTQKGPDVTLPFGVTAPVRSSHLYGGSGIPEFTAGPPGGAGPVNTLTTNGANRNVEFGAGATPPLSTLAWGPNGPGLTADLSASSSPSVNDFRLAFALQRYQEARAQYGSRYTEYLRYLGVRSSDARLDRPEYLGGGRATISFSEVLRTGNSDDTVTDAPVGEMRGHGISAMRTRRFIRFFEEHGICMTLASIRPRTMYMDQLEKSWSRRTKEDYWQKELEQIGQQERYNKEVWGQHSTPDGVFGWNDRYAEYRHLQSYVTGDFRTTMKDWHMGREFASDPTLNSDFIECVPTKRIHAEQTQDVIWGMFSHSIQARRLVGKKTIGRIF